MKKTISCLAALLALVIVTGCGSNCDSEEEEYKGIKLSKRLIESIQDYYNKEILNTSLDKNSAYFEIRNCGEYIALKRVGGGRVLMDEDGDTVVIEGNGSYPYIGEFSNGLAAAMVEEKRITVQGRHYPENRYIPVMRFLRADGTYLKGGDSILFIGPWMAGNAFYFTESQIGVMNDKGETIVKGGKYTTSLPIDNGLIIVESSKGYGFLDNNGQELQPMDYEAVVYKNGFLFVMKNNKWGMVDNTAKVILPIEYEKTEFEHIKTNGKKEVLAKVYKSGKCGIINKNGEFSIPCDYEGISRCSHIDGYIVKKNGKEGIVDFSNKEIWPLEFDNIYSAGNDLIDVEKGGRRGVMTRKGEWFNEPTYTFGAPIYGDLLLKIDNNGNCGAVNANGETVIPFIYTKINQDGGFLRTFIRGGAYGVYNFKGKEIAECKSQRVDCYDDFAITGLYDQRDICEEGVDSKEGKNLVPHEYRNISSYDNFFLAFGLKKSAIYSREGKKLHEYDSEISTFYKILNGYCFYNGEDNNCTTVFIDKYGNHLFEIDGKFPYCESTENSIKDNQMKMMERILNAMASPKSHSPL